MTEKEIQASDEEIEQLKEENKKQKELNNTLYKSLERVGKINNELKVQVEELENEKCKLLGLIQGKDKQIEKMKCCATCKYWNYKDIQKYCNKRTGTSEFAERSLKCDKWELAE